MNDLIIQGKRAGSNWIRKSGTILDLMRGRYQQYESILGMKSGTWKKLPQAEYLLIFKTIYVKCEACNLEDFEKGNKGHYQLSLVHKRRRIIVHESKNKEEIFTMAKQLSVMMQLPVRDSASDRRQPQWLKEAAVTDLLASS